MIDSFFSTAKRPWRLGARIAESDYQLVMEIAKIA